MAREPDGALLMTASGSLDIFLTRLLRMKPFLQKYVGSLPPLAKKVPDPWDRQSQTSRQRCHCCQM